LLDLLATMVDIGIDQPRLAKDVDLVDLHNEMALATGTAVVAFITFHAT
jgi:hypothetical protein